MQSTAWERACDNKSQLKVLMQITHLFHGLLCRAEHAALPPTCSCNTEVPSWLEAADVLQGIVLLWFSALSQPQLLTVLPSFAGMQQSQQLPKAKDPVRVWELHLCFCDSVIPVISSECSERSSRPGWQHHPKPPHCSKASHSLSRHCCSLPTQVWCRNCSAAPVLQAAGAAVHF